jgi:hypothetical protein
MYLRTTKRQNQDGTVVEYYQLAHNFRHPETNKPVARIIHNFGRADQLDRQSLVRLCHSIARVCGLEFPESEATAASAPEVSRLPSDLKLLRTLERRFHTFSGQNVG